MNALWTPSEWHIFCSLEWRHNEIDVVSNDRRNECVRTVCSGADQRKHQSSASLAFVRGIHRWPVNSPHKGPVRGENVSIWWRHHDIVVVPALSSHAALEVVVTRQTSGATRALGGTARWLQLQPSSAWPRPTVSAFQYFRWCALTKPAVSHFLRQIYSLSKEEAL